VRAARALAASARNGEFDPAHLDEETFERHLFTAGMPDPDLVIRTSGEKRISNFLLWQCAYSEFVFMDKLWPDFTAEDLEAAVAEYRGRRRRYGAAG
jgi:undecaprenyl diphosphate synthase